MNLVYKKKKRISSSTSRCTRWNSFGAFSCFQIHLPQLTNLHLKIDRGAVWEAILLPTIQDSRRRKISGLPHNKVSSRCSWWVSKKNLYDNHNSFWFTFNNTFRISQKQIKGFLPSFKDIWCLSLSSATIKAQMFSVGNKKKKSW